MRGILPAAPAMLRLRLRLLAWSSATEVDDVRPAAAWMMERGVEAGVHHSSFEHRVRFFGPDREHAAGRERCVASLECIATIEGIVLTLRRGVRSLVEIEHD